MKNSDRPSAKAPRDLSVQPEDAATVRGGWLFGFRLPTTGTPVTTTTTTTFIKIDGIEGESTDAKHKD